MDLTAYLVKIQGRVQGVGFRYFTLAEADKDKIFGWVKNCHDHSVEALIIGSDEKCQAFLKKLKEGPAYARVDSIETEPWPEAPPMKDFQIR